ncbi:protein-cysteine N-palmitoyltransferase HHAT-like [Gigantopelta aegis]|uniref:protein-cysteine N-palmitoyltransferase HHAT-like n=1 Tax=Gigantopelta aegis TaxID=1735272 RepID=UPI001B88B61B|nr:protein-cysteine N-palmitoyltransferase HHAT-like [Gigantopelta aegis]
MCGVLNKHLFSFQFRNLGYLLFSLVYLLRLFGWKIVLLFISHGCAVFFASTFCNSAVVWATSLGLMCTINFDQSQTLINSLMTSNENKEENLYLITLELVKVNLKCTSFCLEKVNNQLSNSSNQNASFGYNKCKKHTTNHTDISSRSHSSAMNGGQLPPTSSELNKSFQSDKPSDHYGLLDLFQYMFYFSLLFCAPFVTYNIFNSQINSNPLPWNRRKLYDTIFVFLRIAFWAFIVEFSLHHLYFSAMMFNPYILKRVSHCTLMGIGYLQGQFKMVKYLVFYSLTGQMAGLEGIEVPGPPSCISYIYRYSQMWKLFDKGIYNFTKRYIYIPLGGYKAGLPRKLFGSFLCFMFFYNYHGLDVYLLIWCLLNFAELVIEVCASLLENTPAVQTLEASII